MAVPRADQKLQERIKKLEQELRRIKLVPSLSQSAVEPLAVKGSGWFDSTAGNEPKVFDGTDWVPVRDETIAVAQDTATTADANATAAAAAASAAAADAIAALDKFPITETDITDGAISTPKLAAGAIDGVVITGALIRTAASGRRVEQTEAGFVVYDADNSPLILFPTDPSLRPSFKGAVEADRLSVVNGAVLYGLLNELAIGAVMTLQSGVTPPKAAPVVTVDWTSIQWGVGYGLHWDGTNWLTIFDTSTPSLDTYSPSTGALVSSISLSGFATNGLRPWGGVTKIGTEYFVLAYDPGVPGYLILKLDSTGAATLSVTYTPLAGANGSGGNVSQALAPAAIGTDGTNVLIAEYDQANTRYRIQTRSPSTLSISSTVNTNVAAGGPVVGVTRGTFDFGADRIVIATRSNGIVSSNASGTLQTTEAFPAPATGVAGFAWNGTNFYSGAYNGGSPRLFKHTVQRYTAGTWYAASTWYKTVDGYETPMGPVAVFTPKSRSRVTFTGGAIPPGGPDSIRFYLGSASPARTDLWRQTDPGAGVVSQSYESIVTSGSNPPSAGTFPGGGTAAKIQNPDASVVVAGDGLVKGSTVMRGTDNVAIEGPYAYCILNGNHSTAGGSFSNITNWQAEVAANGIVLGSGTTLTVPRAGRYRCTLQLCFPVSITAGSVIADVRKNGTSIAALTAVTSFNTSNAPTAYGSKTLTLAANDTLQCRSFKSQANPVNIANSPELTFWQLEWVGP